MKQGSNKILTVKLIGGHILVVRQLEFQLFVMPVWSREHVAFKNPCALAASLHWETAASEAVIISRISPHPAVLPSASSWPEETVTVLVRETSDGFHTVRQYDFSPNVEGMLVPGHTITLPCILPTTYTRTSRQHSQRRSVNHYCETGATMIHNLGLQSYPSCPLSQFFPTHPRCRPPGENMSCA